MSHAIGAAPRHSRMSKFPSYEGRVMCGYQGWFRAPDDGTNEGWGHYSAGKDFNADHLHIDFWPDVREYVPCVTPGFSWHNLAKNEFFGDRPLNQIPRQQGQFYWGQINAAKAAGATMLYVAMFDEMDEGTAIFKFTNTPPVGVPACDYEGQSSDQYLWLTGEAGKLLRGETSPSATPPVRSVPRRPA